MIKQSKFFIMFLIFLSFSCKEKDNKQIYYEVKFKNDVRKIQLILDLRPSFYFDESSKGEIVNLTDLVFEPDYSAFYDNLETCDRNKVNYRYKVVKSLKMVIFAIGVDGIWNTDDDLSCEIDISAEAPELYVFKKGKSNYFDPSDFK